MLPPAPELALREGLTIGYGRPVAVAAADIVLQGGTHFLLARNGRGKTTLLRTLARTLKAVSGEFSTQGAMQYLPEDLRFDPELTPKTIFRSMLPKGRLKAALELATRIELDVKKPYSKLSTGNRRKTSLIMAELSVREGQANILLLDEPFSGLDAHARAAFEEIWRAGGSDILRLVSCHPDYDAMPMESAVLIREGRISLQQEKGQTWSSLKNHLN